MEKKYRNYICISRSQGGFVGRGFVEFTIEYVIYVSTALGAGLSNVHRVSRAAAIWQTAKFSDEVLAESRL